MARLIVLAKCYDKQGRLLSSAYNSYNKTHPIMAYLAKAANQNRFKIFLHAEVLAILRAGDKNIHRITIERYHKNGAPALAKPCEMCQLFIKMNDIKEVVHT